jgi:serine/threonine protein kinase
VQPTRYFVSKSVIRSFIFSTRGIPVICIGLDYLHKGCSPPIIHRDVKSSNILLGRNLQAKIADMGLSRSYLSDTQTHISVTAAGTSGYMDPEYVDLSLWYTITFSCLFRCSLFSKFRICSKTSKIFIVVWNMFSFSHSL